jgi:hypothetical protein
VHLPRESTKCRGERYRPGQELEVDPRELHPGRTDPGCDLDRRPGVEKPTVGGPGTENDGEIGACQRPLVREEGPHAVYSHGARAFELESSHVPLLSQPKNVFDLIHQAADEIEAA